MSLQSSTWPRFVQRWVGIVGLWAAVVGCRTEPDSLPSLRALRSEIGILNFETAVHRLGPPSRTVELKDHSVIAEWDAGTATPPSVTLGLGSTSGAADTTTGPTVGGGVFHRFRQLQFDSTRRLVLVQDIRR